MGRARVVAATAVLAVLGSLLTIMLLGDDDAMLGASGVVSTQAVSSPTDVVWSTEGEPPNRPPVAGVHVDREVVVVTSSGGHHGFDMRTGDLRWRLPLDLAGHGVVLGEGLLVGSVHGSVVAFDVRDGTRTWAWQEGGASPDEHGAAPVLSAFGEVFVATAPDVLVALDADTGSQSWRLPVRVELDASLTGIVGHGRDLLHLRVSRPPGAGGPTVTRHVVAVDPGTAQVRWEVDAPLGALVDDDRLYIPQPDGQVRVTDASSGAAVGSVELPLAPPDLPTPGSTGHPVARDVVGWLQVFDGVLLAAVDGRMAAVSVESGQTLWTVQLPEGHGRVISADATSAYLPTPTALIAVDLDDGVLREIDQRDDGSPVGWTGGPDGLVVEIGADTTLTASSRSQVLWASTVVTPTQIRPQTTGEVGVASSVPGRVQMLDVEDGGILWESPAAQRGPPVTPAAALGQQIVVLRPIQDADPTGTGWMELAAVAAESGEPVWARQLDEGLLATSDLVATRDAIYLGAATGVSAHAADDGRTRWVLSTDGLRIRKHGAVTHLAPAAGTLAFVVGPGPLRHPIGDRTDASRRLRGDERLLVVADSDDGDVRWQRELPVCGRPSTIDGAVLVPTATGVTSLDLVDGAVQWVSEMRRPSCWSPVSVGGTIAIADDTSTVAGLDATTGAHRWTTELGGTVSAQPTIAGDGLLVPTGDRLIELDLDDGRIRWQIDAPHRIDAPPIVVDGALVISSAIGQRSALR